MLRKIAIIFIALIVILITIQLALLTQKSAENYGNKAIERYDNINKFKQENK